MAEFTYSSSGFQIIENNSGKLSGTPSINRTFLRDNLTCYSDLSEYEVTQVQLFLGFKTDGDWTDYNYYPTFIIGDSGPTSWSENGDGARVSTSVNMTTASDMTPYLGTILLNGAPNVCSSYFNSAFNSGSDDDYWLNNSNTNVSYFNFYSTKSNSYNVSCKWNFTIPASALTSAGKIASNWFGKDLYLGTAVSNTNPQGNLDYQTNWSTFPRIILTLQKKVSSYTITYYDNNKDEYNNWPADVTVIAGGTFTVPSAIPYRYYDESYSYITLNYNYSGSTSTSGQITQYKSDRVHNWIDSDTSITYERGSTYTPTKNMTLVPTTGWWGELNTTGFTLPTPTRSGYTFDGWYSSSTGGTKVGNGGDTYTNTTYSTIYAHWNPIYYTVSYNANGGSNAPSSQSFAYGTEITLGSAATRSSSSTITTTFSSRGSTYSTKTSTATTTYPFNGWALNSTNGTVYSAGAKYTVTGNVTFYAKWGNGSTTGSQVSFPSNPSNYSTTTTNGCSVTLNSNYSGGSNSTKTANLTTTYTFKNWNTNSNGTGTSYTSSSTYRPTSNSTLYAQWNSSSTGTITVTAADAPIRDGYNFIGWSETSTGTNTEMEKTISYTSAGSKTLYAQWEVANYITTLTYFTSSNNSNAAKVYYCEDGKTFIPIAKVHYYTGSTWTDVGNQIPYIE